MQCKNGPEEKASGTLRGGNRTRAKTQEPGAGAPPPAPPDGAPPSPPQRSCKYIFGQPPSLPELLLNLRVIRRHILANRSIRWESAYDSQPPKLAINFKQLRSTQPHAAPTRLTFERVVMSSQLQWPLRMCGLSLA